MAIKVINLETAEDAVEDIQQEISVLSKCDSPFITKYTGSYLKGSELWIIMEYMAGSVMDLVTLSLLFSLFSSFLFSFFFRNGRGFSLNCSYLFFFFLFFFFFFFSLMQMKPGAIEETHATVIIRELCKGLEYLHSLSILHRDIKGISFLVAVRSFPTLTFLLFFFFFNFFFSPSSLVVHRCQCPRVL